MNRSSRTVVLADRRLPQQHAGPCVQRAEVRVRMIRCHLGHVTSIRRLAHWCVAHLGNPRADEIFRSGYLAAVIGLRLADDRAVVVKVRPGSARVAACVEVQRRLFEAAYPCPEPLTGAAPFGDDVATAEAYVPGGAVLPSADRAAWAFAEALAPLVKLAPRPAEVSSLDPAPSWAAWDHGEAGLWPRPEDSGRRPQRGGGSRVDRRRRAPCPWPAASLRVRSS